MSGFNNQPDRDQSSITDYESANAYLGKKQDRPLHGRSTRLVRIGVYIVVRYHDTNIVEYHPDGKILLNSGGWRTITTKSKINEYTPKSWHVRQDKGVWRAVHSYGYESTKPSKAYLFTDGMILHKDGHATGTKRYTKEASKAELKLRKRIRKYAKAYIEALLAGKIPEPSNGDCWHCAMRTTEGKTLGEHTGPDHLKSHMSESYFVPSLAFRAMEVMGASMACRQGTLELMQNRGVAQGKFFADIAARDLPKIIRRYMYRQFGLASSN